MMVYYLRRRLRSDTSSVPQLGSNPHAEDPELPPAFPARRVDLSC